MKGLDYFPLSCHMDDSVKLMEAEYGLEGFAFVIKLWQSIYSGEGYYKYYDEDVCLMLAKELSISATKVDKLVKTALKRGIFDRELYKNYKILTSKGIQNRFFKCAERRKTVSVKTEYLLIDEEEISNLSNGEAESYTEDCEEKNVSRKQKNVCKSLKNVNKKTKNADILKQSKEEESKEKKSREEQSKGEESKAKQSKEKSGKDSEPEEPHDTPSLYGELKNVSLTNAEYEKLRLELGAEALADYIEKADEYVGISGKSYKNFYLLIKKWYREDSKAANGGKLSGKASAKLPVKRSRFNNYNDTNKKDYSHLEEEILQEMLEG